MQTTPDGVETFSSRAEAARLDSPPLLIVDAVTGFLDSRGLGKAPGRAAFLVSDGHGQPNVTYRIQRDRDELLQRMQVGDLRRCLRLDQRHPNRSVTDQITDS